MEKVNSILLGFCLILFMACSRKNILSTAINLPEENKNVTIMEGSSFIGPCEPTIFVSPIDQNIIIAGSVLDNIHFSTDGGKTWTNKKLKSSYGVYGDPVTIMDAKGKMYYAHLSNPEGKAYNSEGFLDRIVVQTSNDGVTWTDGSFPINDLKKDQDKHWLFASPLDNTILMSWTEFDKYGSKEDHCKSRILFSKSTDQGKTWSDAMALSEMEGDCIDDDNTTEGAVPVVGIDGTYYVVWSYGEKIYLDVSKDHGKTWLKSDKVIATQPGGWSFDIPGISRCNGMPNISVDHSKGKNRGTVYVSWADQRNGVGDTDVWLISSKDNGNTWSKPIRVNDDEKGKQQFFSWMDVDAVTGNIFIVFYDRRKYIDNSTDVFLAYSTNGGATFINKKISESSFIPNKDVFFGDYNNISAYNGVVRPIWTRLDQGKLSVHTALIDVKQ